MAKLPSLKYAKFVRSKGKVYAYFNTGKKVAGKFVWTALPSPASVGFYDSYIAMLGARTKRESSPRTVAATVEQFQASDDFKKLSLGSQKLYRSTFKRITEELGKFPVDAVERKHVREVVSHRIAGNGAKNVFLKVLSLFYTWARDNELTDKRPAEGFKPFSIGSHEPWPDDLLRAALIADDDRTRLAVHLLYYTGLRIGDVVRLRWSDIRDGKIYVMPQKSSRRKRSLDFPLPSPLAAELARTPKRGITIIVNWRGQQMGDDRIRMELKAFAAALGFDVVPHGLRKNAVNTLLEAGCTVNEVMSITGQSPQIVQHYAKRVDQSRLSEAAIIKLERNAKAQTDDKTGAQSA